MSDTETQRVVDAAAWLSRLRQDPVDPEELAAWLAWYESDELNKNAYDDISAFWQQADQVADEPNPLSSDLWLGQLTTPSGARMRTSAIADDAAKIGSAAHRRTRRTKRRLAWAATAAVALIASFVVLPEFIEQSQTVVRLDGPHAFASTAPTTSVATPITVRAAPELVRENELPDGSRVALAEKSAVSVQYSVAKRTLVMDHGVAYFTVAHNRLRPFIVKVGKLNVRAVGTAFNIRNTGDRVVVTVTEGTVEIYPQEASATDVVRAAAGKEVVWANNNPLPTVASVDVSRALAWQQGVLDYLNEPLGSAIEDINRYTTRHVVIRDLAAARIVFSGTVFTDSIDSWINALPKLFPVDVKLEADGTVVITSRSSA